MKIEKNEYGLLDLVEVEFLQELQDLFSKFFNFSCLTYDKNKAITHPTNFSDFCSKYVFNAEDSQKCSNCALIYGAKAAEKRKPEIFTCHFGIKLFAIPIIFKNKHLGTICCGQFFLEPPNEEEFRKIAREKGYDEQEFIADLRKINIVPEETIQNAAQMLYFIANTITKVCYKNYELLKTREREEKYEKIAKIVRMSIEKEDAKTKIVDIIGKTLGADRCVIVEYDSTKQKIFPVRDEYLSSIDIESFKGVDLSQKTPDFVEMVKKGKVVIVNNKLICFENDIDKFKKEKEIFKNCPELSLIIFPLYYAGELTGALALSYLKIRHIINQEEIDLLKLVAADVATAIHQSKLLKITKKQFETESAIRKILEVVKSSLDMDVVMQRVVKELGQIFKADRCYFRSFSSSKEQFFAPVVEYVSSPDVTSMKDIEPNQKGFKYFADEVRRQKKGFYPILMDLEMAKGTPMEQYLIENGIKADYAVPIIDRNDQVLWLVLHYMNEHPLLSEDDKKIIETIAYQIEIAFEQISLYNKIKNIADREVLLRKIMATSVNNLNIKDVINSIVNEVGVYFRADRCTYAEYEEISPQIYQVNDYAEYLSSAEIKSSKDCYPNQAGMQVVVDLLKKRRVLKADDINKVKMFPENRELVAGCLCVKSYLVAPIYFGETDYGAINLHFVTDYRNFTSEEVDLLSAVAHQAAIAIHQTKLYSEIKKNENYTRAVIDSIKDALVTIDENGIILSANPVCEKIWGYPLKEITGEKIDLLFEEESCKNYQGVYKNISSGKKKQGNIFPVEVEQSRINFENKDVTLLLVRDITERKKMETMKSEFVSTVSHELRTPLTSINGSLGLVKSGVLGELPPKAADMINIASTNCTRLTNLINDILDLEKIKAGKYEFKYEEIGVNSIIEHSILLNQSYADSFGMKTKYNLLKNEVYIRADKNRLLQVISNLFSNAVKFSKLDDVVEISVEVFKDKVRVSFKDNGIGIADSSKHKIFQSFSQVDSSDTRAKGGTGLGLSICKIIVEKMGGEIDFVSKENVGSTFYFVFQIIEAGSLGTSDPLAVVELGEANDAW